MISFEYSRANDVAEATRQIAGSPGAQFIAGGTNLIDLMKMDVERPTRLIDISRLPLDKIEETRDGGLRVGSQHRPRLSSSGAAPLSGALERAPCRRLAAAAQHGLDRRESSATHTLQLLLR